MMVRGRNFPTSQIIMYLQYPYALWGLLLIPLIILLRLWRMKPVTITIPSIFIWQKISAATSEPPLRRKRLLLLLILQCLGVGSLVLALSHPIRSTFYSVSRNVIILLDNSASLKTIAPSGQTRWENLTGELSRILQALDNESRLTIITASGGFTSVVTEQTPADSLKHLKTLQPTDAPADLTSLINHSAGLINRSPPSAAVYFGSDQPPPDNLMDLLKIKPVWLLQGEPSDNSAITHLAATPGTGHNYDIFMTAHNFSKKNKIGRLIIYSDRQEIFSAPVELPPETKRSLTFPALDLLTDTGVLPEVIQATLTTDDDLKCDNTVWLNRQEKSTVKICLTGSNNALLLKILQSLPHLEIEYFPERSDIPNNNYDLYIYNNNLPDSIRTGAQMVLINPPDDFGPFRIKGKISNPQISYVNQNSPFLSYVDLKQIHIWEAVQVEILPEEKDYFQLLVSGSDPSRPGQTGVFPLIGDWLKSDPTGPSRIVLINFDLTWRGADKSATDWPLDVSFPVFWTNLINELTGDRPSTGEYAYHRTAQPLFLNLKDIGAQTSRAVTLVGPDGVVRSLSPANQILSFTPLQTGLYEIRGGAAPRKIAVNLCDESESNNNGETLSSPDLSAPMVNEKIFTVSSQSMVLWLAVFGLILLVAAWWLERQEL